MVAFTSGEKLLTSRYEQMLSILLSLLPVININLTFHNCKRKHGFYTLEKTQMFLLYLRLSHILLNITPRLWCWGQNDGGHRLLRLQLRWWPCHLSPEARASDWSTHITRPQHWPLIGQMSAVPWGPIEMETGPQRGQRDIFCIYETLCRQIYK